MKVFAAFVLFLAGLVPVHADTVTPTFEETVTELAVIGNDVTFQNVTPETLQATIDAWEAAHFPGGTMTTVPDYEAIFYSDGSAFLFRVPLGTVIPLTSVPEPSTLLLLAVPILLLGLSRFPYHYARHNAQTH